MTMAQLVLAYNLLAYNNVVDIRKELKKRIYDLLGIELRTDTKSVVAVENQFTELKTSIIYPADKENNMYANEKLQIEEIMKVVCSFMNAKGGTIYIGVSDAGVAVGLDADFAYLNKGHKEYDINNIRDIFDRRVRDAVYSMLGVIANNGITSSFEQIDGQWVYKLDVEPSPEIIKLNDVAYVRQGTSKYPIPESKLAAFRKNRDKEFSR
jgi:predicted HTH transcriptional regulator